jgi:tRNA threonylcarbamoyladenosine biosynthesis protein TsaB
MDAQRGEVVARPFARQPDGRFEPTGPQALIPIDAWFGQLGPGAVITGPILGKLVDRLPSHVRAIEPDYWPPRASAVAWLADRDYALGRRDDLWNLLPRYCRRSAAEEKQGL